MSGVAIAGVGMHPFGRFPEKTLKDLARVAVLGALDDAGLGVKDVDAVYSANALAGLLQGQEQIRGQSVLREVGIDRVPVVNVENACASGSSALREGVLAIRAGAAPTVLVVGFEKMFVGDRDRSLAALESAADLDLVHGLGLQFTAVYALRLRKALESGRLAPRHLVDVTVKSHANGALNPLAAHREPVTPEQVTASRPIADPLTLLMCSSICDGAAACVLVADDDPRLDGRPRVRVRGSSSVSAFVGESETDTPGALCATTAYEEAGVAPHELDVVECHDAMAPAELLYYEQLGLCEPGEAGDLLEQGATALGGRTPVNPSGGLCSRGHPVGATGVAQIAELVWQLRGEAGARQAERPRLALAHNSGGWVDGQPAATNVHILERVDPWD
jgi:acetyl-CoA acetyltransferase